MIAIPSKKLLLITPPKTASCSLHTLLCEGHGCVYVVGPRMISNVDTVYDQHTFHLAPIYHKTIYDNYKVVCVVRNPYARLLSLYKHSLIMGIVAPRCTFENFYKNIVDNRRGMYDSFFHNISQSIKLCKEEDVEFWKIEDIHRHLKENDLPTDLPDINKIDGPDLSEINFDCAMDWIQPDLELLGYEKL